MGVEFVLSLAGSIISLHLNLHHAELLKKLRLGVPCTVIILITKINVVKHTYQKALVQIKSKQRMNE